MTDNETPTQPLSRAERNRRVKLQSLIQAWLAGDARSFTAPCCPKDNCAFDCYSNSYLTDEEGTVSTHPSEHTSSLATDSEATASDNENSRYGSGEYVISPAASHYDHEGKGIPSPAPATSPHDSASPHSPIYHTQDDADVEIFTHSPPDWVGVEKADMNKTGILFETEDTHCLIYETVNGELNSTIRIPKPKVQPKALTADKDSGADNCEDSGNEAYIRTASTPKFDGDLGKFLLWE